DWRDGREASAQFARQKRRHTSAPRESCGIDAREIRAQLVCHVIDHVTDKGNIVGPLVVDGDIPSATLCLRTCDCEPLPRGNFLKACNSGLTGRRPTAGVEVEDKR